MVEPLQSAPGDGAAPERHELLATKITIPRIRPDRLPRSRLVEALDGAMARKLTLVCTPAGFGKTTLLADRAESAKGPVAWLSLDPEDNDPVRFWRYVVAALDRAGLPVGERVRSVLGSPGGASSQGVVTALINKLGVPPAEAAAVLDDYHTVESRSIHDGVALLLSHLPPQLHIVISSRADPPLPLARLRARDQLAELRAADLRFTPEESAALLRDVWGLDLSAEAIAVLETRTEGWAVGLQLAALSLRERPDPKAFLDAFTGTHRYVIDYLTEEVLERQPDPVRSFLVRTSILERLTGPLCDAVTGRSDGQAMLEALERANLFLVPLDGERRWYRLHHLFADLLRARLLQTSPDLIPELHRRGGAWCEEHRLIDGAIRHAMTSGDAPWAARLVEENLNETLRRGEGVVLERWLSALPDDAVRSRPRLCLAQGEMQLHLGHLGSAERLAEHAERAFDHGPKPTESQVPTAGGMVAEMPAAIALLRADVAAARGDAERSVAHARSALAQMDDEERSARLFARFLLASADWMGGRLEDAERGFGEVLAEGREAPDPYPLTSSCFKLGQAQRTRGRLSAALRTYREGLRFATERGGFSAFHAGEAHIGIAEVLYERNRLDDALRHVTEGIALCRNVVEFQLPALGLVTLAWIRQATGEAESALEAMDEACAIRPSPDIVALWNPAPSERARLLLAQGREEEAERWVEERRLSYEDDISYPRESDHLVLVRVFLARPDPGRALRVLERLDSLAASQGRTESLIRIRALRSLALQSAGDHGGALALLAEALSAARREGYVRIFSDEGPPMAALLRSLIGTRRGDRVAAVSGPAREHLNRVVRAFGAPVRRAEKAVPAVAGVIEPLTERELEVLRLIAEGMRNREIAEKLVVTVETVKKHVSHIFGKLGATNRTEAVVQARELGLLS